MLRKLIFLTIIAIFLTGCGASAPETDNKIADTAPATSSILQSGEGTTEPQAAFDGTTESADDIDLVPEYFLFTKRTNTVTNEDGVTLLTENQSIPTFTSADAARSEWVTELLSGLDRDYASDSRNLLTYAEEYVEQNGTEYFYSYSNYQTLGIARHDERVVSLLSLCSLYSGGTHLNVQTAHNLDIDNQRTLTLEDIITESGAEELAAMVLASVNERFAPIDGSNGLFNDYASTIGNSFLWGSMTPYWYLNDVGLVIFYNQYELAPYAERIIKVELPYETLGGILLDEYLPAESNGTPGSLVLRSDAEDCSRIPIVIEPEGETLCIGVEGQVHQVQICEVSWAGETPHNEQFLFSAMTLGENDVLELTGGYTDENRSFAIVYTNGLGERKICYIHASGLSEEP